MNCPRCTGPQLMERDRDGITVDICPDCRGVWLDRGELEKLVQRALTEIEAAERGWSGATRPPLPATATPADPRDGDLGPSRMSHRDGDRDRDRDRDRLRDGDRDRHDRDGYRRYRDDDDDDDHHRRGRKKGWLDRLGDVFD